VARDYGGTQDGQPWHGAQPPYQGQPPYGQLPPYWERQYAGQPPYGGPPYGQPPRNEPPYGGQPSFEPHRREPAPDPDAARRHRIRVISVAGLVLGIIGLIVFGIKAGIQMAPRKFTTAQQQEISNWEFGKRWRDLPAGTIFPTSVSYPAPAALDDDLSLKLSAQRVGVANQASCVSAADPAVAAVLVRDGCSAILRATYVDGTDSYVVTVGAAVLPDTDEAASASHAIGGVVGLGSGVHAVSFKGTPAADFTDEQRQLSGVLSSGTYVVLYTVGYTGSRPKEQVTADDYAKQEMTSAGAGVARDVLSVLGAPVPPPRCPGAPGC
jgi:hypothetical protein